MAFTAWNTPFRQAGVDTLSSFGAGRLTTIEKADVVGNGTLFFFTSCNGDDECVVLDFKGEMIVEKMLAYFFC